MRVALLGATGTIGSAVLAHQLAAGHEVTALVREPIRIAAGPNLTLVQGDARDPTAVARVLAEADIVVAAVGPRTNTPEAVRLLTDVTQNVIEQMRARRLSRIVFIAGAAVQFPGERRSPSQRVISWIVRRLARYVVEGKERETALYLASDLAWTAMRPGRVMKGAATGHLRMTADRPAAFRVTSGDLAVAIQRVIDDPAAVHKAPYVSS